MPRCVGRGCVVTASVGGLFCELHWSTLPNYLRRKIRQRIRSGVHGLDQQFAAAVNDAIGRAAEVR